MGCRGEEKRGSWGFSSRLACLSLKVKPSQGWDFILGMPQPVPGVKGPLAPPERSGISSGSKPEDLPTQQDLPPG